MSLEDGQTIYKLKYDLTYKHKGETKTAQFLDLREPGMSHSRGYYKLKQMVTGLMMSSAQQFENLGIDRDDIVSGTEVKKLHEIDQDEFEDDADNFSEMLGYCFGLSKEVQLDHFVDDFYKIACNSKHSSICVVDGEVPMSSGIWETMHPEDAGGAALAWAAFFTMPSDLKSKLGSASASGSPTPAKAR